ncbi:MAG TPA: condensation domain-containing protein, partial [Longimicrobiaceae bacterium]|nr:condensation domain-containing protein [Longimicrobiaceae bacterium]
WLIDRLQPGDSVYNLSRALRLRGVLDVGALVRALGEVVRRHEALRTVFAEAEGGPVQVVHAEAGPRLELEDLSGLREPAREAALERRVREAARAPFDLAEGPLFRATLLRLGEDDHVLLLGMHHVVGDGWSIGVLFRELEALYGAFLRREPSPLPELPVQYADYAAWQRAWLSGERLERQLAYGRARLADAPALLELPTDRPRPAVQSHRGAAFRFAIPPGLSGRLEALGRAGGATPFMTLLAAFQVLLSRYSGQEDVVVGTPVAGRSHPEVEGLIGLFVNTLALRTDLSGDPTFAGVLERVREATLGAYAHQELPFERLVEELQPERSLGHSPLFQVMLAFQNAGGEPPRLPGVETLPLRTGGGTAMFDLTLNLGESAGGLRGVLEYAVDLFDAATAERMMGHLRVLLEGIAEAPERRLSGLGLLEEAERRQLLEEWNATGRDYPEGECIHDLFAAQAARTPASIALLHRGQMLTYAELERRSNRLAHQLRHCGVGPEVRVAVCLERTPELVVALLAVLKAGGAYVPLDPGQPAERLAYVMEDAGVSLLLTTTALEGRIPAGAARVLRVDAERERIAARPTGAPRARVSPENLAYVIHTSGSPGRPKGVMLRHRGAVVLLRWLRDAVPEEERRSVLGSTPVTFDVSVAEIFGTLCWGGRLVLVENALELAGLREEVSLAVMVPTAAAELLRTGGIPRSVRALNLAGEALPAELVRELYGLETVEVVRNLYGPTEDTVYSTGAGVPRGAGRAGRGRAI